MRIRIVAGRSVLAMALLLSCRRATTTTTTVVEQTTPVTRRAVLVGIDDYSASTLTAPPGAQPVANRIWPTLRGAVRDVDQMREMLIGRYSFPPAGIVTLRNQQATGDAIRQAIERQLIAAAAKGDVLVFYYSGHGSQVFNSLSPELDHLDEAIVPADSPLGAPYIRDKQLAVLFNRILDKGARLTVIFDSCHSGSVSRALPTEAQARGVDPDMRDVRDPVRPQPPDLRGALVLSASQDYARAFEVRDEQGKEHGAFSWALLNAMRATTPRGEPAMDTFLRAQALMRADTPYQDPVIAGNAAAVFPLFSDGTAGKDAGGAVVAVDEVLSNGTLILRGGWAQGLTVGTELRQRAAGGGDTGVRVRIKSMRGLVRSEAQIISGGNPPPSLKVGTLLEITAWSAGLERPLRVWMPHVDDVASVVMFARRLREALAASGIRWVADPIEMTSGCVLRWRDGSWELLIPGRSRTRFGRDVSAASVIAQLPRATSLFVQLPATTSLVGSIGVGPGTDCNNIEPIADPAAADYILVGRLGESGVQYAWVRPEVHHEDQKNTPLPPRTDWASSEPAAAAAIVLRDSILRLHTIMAWQHLQSPPQSPSPYRLVVDDDEGAAPVPGATVIGRRYRLVLRLVDPTVSHVPPRFYYIVGIDSFGRSVLLFPRGGSVENNFPIRRDDKPPEEIVTGLMMSTPPPGKDTFILISSDQSLPNPWVLESPGVRTRGPIGQTALEELLSRTGGSMRGTGEIPPLPIWSIDRLMIDSVPQPGAIHAP